ncbi:MAG: GerMN domain-containing protein [Actinomycetota bacterium]|nr:GerMN domain-containing protein [Actinomycetota bacterium]
MRGRLRGAVAVAAAALLLVGCTGVPANSTPQVIGQVGVSASDTASTAPPAGADPRQIVVDFLDASSTSDPAHAKARQYLTPDAKAHWNDKTVTVVDQFRVSNLVNGAVTLTARKIGSIDATGTYTPELQGDGSGDLLAVPFTFGMQLVSGEWRIQTLPNSVFVTSENFQPLYNHYALYFYDLAQQHLVPDLRYSPLTDAGLLADWLIQQLVAGPRPALADSVTSELPQVTDPLKVSVQVGAPSVITLPGASQLDPQTRNRVAAQLAFTLTQVTLVQSMQIVDALRPVAIPAADGPAFSATTFQSAMSVQSATSALYYIHNGAVVDEAGRPLPGALGSSGGGGSGLSSVALAANGSTNLRIAGVSGTGATQRLSIGTLVEGIQPTAVRGALSRPAWAPGRDEVWVGAGPSVIRVGADRKPLPVSITARSGSVTGSVSAIRFSPEGSRVALVLSFPGGTGQVWVGSIVRSQSQVRIDGLEQVTPNGIVTRDVAWNDPLKLWVVGRNLASGDVNVYEVQIDGALLTPRGTTNLPGGDPDSITVAEGQVPWVSAGQSVWFLPGAAWASPGNGETFGTNPIYVE